jgi:arginine/ornithine N-succinyltransferase beta subunit
MLTTEGFEADNYIDIFDGGAVLTAELDRLQTLERNRCHPVEVAASLPAQASMHWCAISRWETLWRQPSVWPLSMVWPSSTRMPPRRWV